MSEAINLNALTVPAASMLPLIIANDRDGLLAALAIKIAAYRPDGSTPAGRENARSLSYECSTTKSKLVRIGKGMTEKWRSDTKSVNGECTVLEDGLDWLRDTVREPLTNWENIEKDRVSVIEAALLALAEIPSWYASEHTIEDLQDRLTWLRNPFPRDWQEFAVRADGIVKLEIDLTEKALGLAVKRDAERAELIVLREAAAVTAKAEAARKKIEAEAKIAEDAAAAITAAAARAIAKAEQDATDAKTALAQAEADRAAAVAKVEADKAAAQVRADAAQVAAVEAERTRATAETAKAAAAQQVRDADNTNRLAVAYKMRKALIALGLNDDQAHAVAKALIAGDIPHASVTF